MVLLLNVFLHIVHIILHLQSETEEERRRGGEEERKSIENDTENFRTVEVERASKRARTDIDTKQCLTLIWLVWRIADLRNEIEYRDKEEETTAATTQMRKKRKTEKWEKKHDQYITKLNPIQFNSFPI